VLEKVEVVTALLPEEMVVTPEIVEIAELEALGPAIPV